MLSRLSRAGDDGTRGGSAAAGKPSPFRSVKRQQGRKGGKGRHHGHRSPCLLLDQESKRRGFSFFFFFFSFFFHLNNTGKLRNESSTQFRDRCSFSFRDSVLRWTVKAARV